MANSRKNDGKQQLNVAGNPIVVDIKPAEHQRTQAALRAMNDEKINQTFFQKNRPIAASSSAALEQAIAGKKTKEEQDFQLAIKLQELEYTSAIPQAGINQGDHKSSVPLAKSDLAKPVSSAASVNVLISAAGLPDSSTAPVTSRSNIGYKNPASTLEKILIPGVTESILFRFLSDQKDLKTAASFVHALRPNRLSALFKQKTLTEGYKQVKELCQAVVYGEYDKVKVMLEENPSLVLYKARVQDYSYHETDELDSNQKKKRIYRESEGTAYQLALAVDDVNRAILDKKNNNPILDAKGNIQILHPDEGMAEMIESYFIKAYKNDVKAADAEISRQKQEQFPADYEQSETARRQRDSKALNAVIQAISDAKVEFTHGDYDASNGNLTVDPQCEAALKQFREYLMPKGIITSGKHFNIELLMEAFQLYDKKFDDFGGYYDSPKNVLFWCKIIGYIQRYLPACLAQVFCSQLHSVVNNSSKLQRTLVFNYGGATYFPLDSDPRVSLGVDCAAHSRPVGMSELIGVMGAALLQNVCRAKASAVATECSIQTINRNP